MVQVNLEARHVILSPEEDIAERLARLRGEQLKPDFTSKQDSMPDPNLFLSGGDQKTQGAGGEGVDEVGQLHHHE